MREIDWGATFRVWNDEGTFDEELVSDEEGNISVKYIKHGSYHVQETAAPEGYVVYDVDEEGTPAVHDFTVNDQGMIEFDGYDGMTDVFAWTVENMPKSMRTTAIDKSSGTHEGQARGQMTIIDTIEYTGCIPGEEYTVSGTLMDKETGEAAEVQDLTLLPGKIETLADPLPRCGVTPCTLADVVSDWLL